MIRVHEVTQHYGVRPILQNVTLHVPRGELVAVMGPNGMGKSTLLGVIAGTLSPQTGHVEIDGKRRRASAEDELAIRRRVVYLPDHPWLPSNRTGREFLLAVGRLYEVGDDRLMPHVDRLLDLFHLDKQGDAPIHSYSNGQKKKVAVASALVAEAEVMLLDEPFTGGLDPSGILALRRVLQHLAGRDDVTVVLASQVPEIVESLADRVAVLRGGRIASLDTIEAMLSQTGSDSLEEALEQLINPHTLENIDRYFEGEGG